ncbi:MAG: sigma-70 family RNA polymerase sigma factor [Planctomycetes bacterium]|nr:sigma-70 family RNA polymerase sigma factor [Planctomycetota bacterium]MCL4728926.1 sigma-70 family RNA polymerase sigma factor [Planctomycetota bacterium]
MAIETTQQTDGELAAAYLRGDIRAFEQLYDRHRRGLFGYALALCADAALAADAAQDTWLAVVEQTRQFAAARNFRAYLYRAARNRVLELARAAGRARRAAQNAAPLVRPVTADAETAARLNAALLELPPEQREVVLLRIYEDMTFPEIAEVTGLPVKTIESRQRLALEKLRAALPEDTP